MDQEQLKALGDVIGALTTFVQLLGVWPSTTIIVVGLGGVVGYRIWRDHRLDGKVDAIVQEKEKEILRLADVNREYRTAVLKMKGFPEDSLKADSADSAQAKKKREIK